MRILAPASAVSEVAALVEAGADEVYCGVRSDRWCDTWSNVASINRVERRMGNLRDHATLAALVREAHRCGVRVNVAVNVLFSPGQYEMLGDEIERILDTGPDALIVADPGLALLLAERVPRPEVHASTGATVFNARAAMFWGKLGANRIVLPRSLRMDEMAALVAGAPSLAFEAFVLNGGCLNIDGFCTFHHGLGDERLPQRLARSALGAAAIQAIYRLPAGPRRAVMHRLTARVSDNACTLPYDVTAADPAGRDHPITRRAIARVRRTQAGAWDATHVCGLCDLHALHRSGVFAVKIVGRTFTGFQKRGDVALVRSLLDLLPTFENDEGAFRAEVRMRYRRTYGMDCRGNCLRPA